MPALNPNLHTGTRGTHYNVKLSKSISDIKENIKNLEVVDLKLNQRIKLNEIIDKSLKHK